MPGERLVREACVGAGDLQRMAAWISCGHGTRGVCGCHSGWTLKGVT
jgi:hypothetical protein